MNKLVWKVIAGTVITLVFIIPFWLSWIITSWFDHWWDYLLWVPLFHRPLPLIGFLLSIGIFYLVGVASETKWGIWMREKFLRRIPIIGHFVSSFNPHTRTILQESKGAVLAQFQSEWRPAFITAVHKTRRGYLASVLYLSMPPTPQLLDENSLIYVLECRYDEGRIGYTMIPTNIALRQELSVGTTVPEHAYQDAVCITLGAFLEKSGLVR